MSDYSITHPPNAITGVPKPAPNFNLHFLEQCTVGDPMTVSEILDSGRIDVNYQHPVNQWTGLHWACKRGHERVVDLLLEHGANPAIVNNEGRRPIQLTESSLVHAALTGYIELHERGLCPTQDKDTNVNASTVVTTACGNVKFVSTTSPPTVEGEGNGGMMNGSDADDTVERESSVSVGILPNARSSSNSSSFVPNYLKNPSFPYNGAAPANATETKESVSTSHRTNIDEQPGSSTRPTSIQSNIPSSASHQQPIVANNNNRCTSCNTLNNSSGTQHENQATSSNDRLSPSNRPNSRQRTHNMRLCIALPIIFKSAHEPEKKLYRNLYISEQDSKSLQALHRHVATAIACNLDHLTTGRLVVVNEEDATLIEHNHDMLRLGEGARIGVFERR